MAGQPDYYEICPLSKTVRAEALKGLGSTEEKFIGDQADVAKGTIFRRGETILFAEGT